LHCWQPATPEKGEKGLLEKVCANYHNLTLGFIAAGGEVVRPLVVVG
jgi:hypothetical protein